MSADALSGLSRFVLPVRQPVPLDANGFLDELGRGTGWAPVGVDLRPVEDLLDEQSSFVMLAAGGVGKSTVLSMLRDLEPSAVEIDLPILDESGMRDEILAAIESGGPVYLDSLDEAALHKPAVFRVLQRYLVGNRAINVRWRLACRPAAWSAGLAETLRTSLPGFEELRLLPLSRRAAGHVVADVVEDPDVFIDALVEANLGRLAASPMRLRGAAVRWHVTGELPVNHVDAIDFEIRGLLSETDQDRPQPSLSVERQLRIAGRLGAFAVFGGTSRFSRTDAGVSVQPVRGLPTAPEPDEPGQPVEVAHYEEVLGTALFDAAPGASVLFRHQQYTEYLAAAYLAKRRITRTQLQALLGVQADGALPGAMVGVTAWLAALARGLVDDLVTANAVMFARAGVELSEDARTGIVTELLSHAAAGDVDMAWDLDLSALVYPGLEDDLARHVNDVVHQPEQLRWIARFAKAGHYRGLAARLLPMAMAPGWPSWARSAAVTAIAELGDDEQLEKLRPLLNLDASEDPDDEVLGATLEALYPRRLTTADLLQALRPRRHRHLVGEYLVLLSRIASQIPLEDLPAALDWATRQLRHGDDAFGRLPYDLLVRAWSTDSQWDSLCRPLARLVAEAARDYTWFASSPHDQPPWTNGSDDRRRMLAVAAASEWDDDWYTLIDLRLVTADGIQWLITELPHMDEPARTTLANCLPWLLQSPTADDADAILSLPVDHPGYEPTESLRQPQSTQSETARRWQQRRAREAEQQAQLDASPHERREHLTSALAAAENDPTSWWRIAWWLSVDERDRAEAAFVHDLTTRPGWSLLSDHEQQRVLDLGVAYLHVHTPTPSEWMGASSVDQHRAVMDWSGVYLLTTLARYDPDQLRELDQTLWTRWAPAIVAAWGYDERDIRLRCDLVDLAPTESREAILAAAINNLDAAAEHAGHLQPLGFYEHVCRDLATTLARRLTTGAYQGDLGRSVLGVLVRNAPEIAAATCRELRGDPSSDLAAMARTSLANLDPAGTVDELVAGSASTDELVEIARWLRLDALDVERLTPLAQLLLDRLPAASDPPFGGHPDNDEYRARETRMRVLDLLAEQGNVAGFQALLEGRTQPDRDLILPRLRRSRQRAADAAFTHVQPNDLVELLRRSDARLVRDDHDLLNVVSAQLDELQHELTHDGAFRDVWNLAADGAHRPKREDDISDWLRRRAHDRLARIVIDREVQVTRPGQGGIGTRVDITATAPTATHPAGVGRVIIEAKLINNPELATAMHQQLIGQYLVPTGLLHGIYLVYWIAPEQRPYGWTRNHLDIGELRQQLEQQAAQAADHVIRPYVLDISRPRR